MPELSKVLESYVNASNRYLQGERTNTQSNFSDENLRLFGDCTMSQATDIGKELKHEISHKSCNLQFYNAAYSTCTHCIAQVHWITTALHTHNDNVS
jgi:hypothetical protein